MAAATASATSAAPALSVPASFVAASPPAQVDQVVKDVRGIVGSEGLPDAALAAARDAHTRSTCPVVTAADGSFVVLCGEGRVAAGAYLNSKSKQLVAVDEHTGALDAAGGAGATIPESGFFGAEGTPIEKTRASIAAAVDAYASKVFTHTGKRHGGAEAFASGSSIVIVTSGIRANLESHWAAQWQSRWVLSAKGGGAWDLTGTMNVTTHYFEDGNVQMRASKEATADPAAFKAASSPEAMGAAVASALSTAEDEYEQALVSLLLGMTAVKNLRRGLPVSGTRMAWTADAHRFRAALVAQSAKDHA